MPGYKLLPSAAVFGRTLIQTGDLDPVYVALRGASLSYRERARVCVAYWCLYHLGAACAIASTKFDEEFWALLGKAAANNDLMQRWPRGTERRHWRGQQAINSLASVRAAAGVAGEPQKLTKWLAEVPTMTSIMARTQQLTGFGPWISFKVADMLERVLEHPVTFPTQALAFYAEPKRGAWYVAHKATERSPDVSEADTKTLFKAVQQLQKQLGNLAAPGGGRNVGVQEIETVLCKWKSHLHGHYPVGKDIAEIRHGLEAWPGKLSDRVLKAMPDAV